MHEDRIRLSSLQTKIVSASQAASHIQNGMTIGMSGFTRSGEAKAVPVALAERSRTDPLKISLLTGASLGHDIDKILAEAGVLARRMPFQADSSLRKRINSGEVMFIDQHLSKTAEMLRSNQLPPIDIALIEATAINETGGIIPTTSVGNSASFVLSAQKIIVEINTSVPIDVEGLHDIYLPEKYPSRTPIPVTSVGHRIGIPYIPADPAKIVAIVMTDQPDSPARIQAPDADTNAIAASLIDFLKHEVKQGRLTNTLMPLQAGIGSIANAVLHGFIDSPFHDLVMYSEVLQDSTFELFEAGKLRHASATSLSISEDVHRRVLPNLPKYKDQVVLRPQEISNHPEIIRRLGIIGINTALEFDIYGNINSTHVGGTMMMNGIGGSGDFARNCSMTIFVTKSLAKNGAISSVVPMVSHIDHCEHDVDILVTEIGLADLRGLAPRERAPLIIRNCAHPQYRDQLMDYYQRALARGGNTPHVLEDALSWHVRLAQTGTMMRK